MDKLDFSVFNIVNKQDLIENIEDGLEGLCKECGKEDKYISLIWRPEEGLFICPICGICEIQNTLLAEPVLYENKIYVGYKLKKNIYYNHMNYFKRRLEYIDGHYNKRKNSQTMVQIRKDFNNLEPSIYLIRKYLRKNNIKGDTKNVNIYLKNLLNIKNILHERFKSDLINIYSEHYRLHKNIIKTSRKCSNISITIYYIIVLIDIISKENNIKMFYEPLDFLKFFKKPSYYLHKKYFTSLKEKLLEVTYYYLTGKFYNWEKDLRGKMEIFKPNEI